MPNTPNPKRSDRFTMLEAKGPNNPSPEELATRVVELRFDERFTMLEAKGPNDPSPEELAARVVELEPWSGLGSLSPAEVPPTVVALVAELAAAVAALDGRGRAAALDFISAELPKRVAG